MQKQQNLVLGPVLAMPQLITRITSQEKVKSNFAKFNERGFNDVLRNLIPTFCTI